jgi:hypothetical protein
VWKLDSPNAPTQTFNTSAGVLVGARFDNQRQRLMATTDKAVTIWPLQAPALPATWAELTKIARDVSSSCLSADQRVRLLHEASDAAAAAASICQSAHGRGDPVAIPERDQ